MERWSTVPGFPGYLVSDQGTIERNTDSSTRGKAGQIIKPAKRSNGYLFVCLCRDGKKTLKSIHQIVMHAFKGEPLGRVVNHIDNNPANNKLENLEYVSQGENCRHAFAIGRSCYEGERNGQAKITESDVRAMRAESTGARGEIARMARAHGISPRQVGDIISRKAWPHVV